MSTPDSQQPGGPKPRRWEDLPFAGEQPVDASHDTHSAYGDGGPFRQGVGQGSAPPPARPGRMPQPARSPDPKRRSKGRAKWPWAAVAVAAIVVTTQANASTGTLTTRDYAGVKALSMTGLDGDVEVRPSSTDRVKITYLAEVPKGRNISVDSYTVGADGTLAITDPCDAFGPNCHTDFIVEVPSGVSVSTAHRLGDLSVTELDGALKATGVNDATVDGIRGSLSIEGRGDIKVKRAEVTALDVQGNDEDIDIELLTVPNTISLGSDDGDIDLTIPQGAYALNFRTANGDPDVCNDLPLVNVGSPGAKVINVKTDRGDFDACTP